MPPQRRYPDRPPLMVKGTLLLVTAIGRFRGDTLDYTSFRSVYFAALLVFSKTEKGIEARAFDAKTAAWLRTFKQTVSCHIITTSAEVSKREVCKQVVNS